MDGSPAVDYGAEEAAMQAYLREGEKRAFALGNRGPIRFTDKGELHPEIVDAYWRCGFYVFEGVLNKDPVQHTQSAAEQERRGQRKENDQLRGDRPRFSRL